jgi:predicted RNase H-like nuclease (RuvC/YqgF family)
MARASSLRILFAVLVLALSPCRGESIGAGAQVAEAQRERSLAEAWGKALDGAGARAKDTPVTRVVNLLKEMQETLGKEMEEDEKLYHELACWCNNGAYEKSEAAEASEAKISELEASIEGLTAKSADLNIKIGELNTQVAADKKALAEAKATREKEIQSFHGAELDSIQALENLKAALVVLSKHEGGSNWMQPALVQLTGQLTVRAPKARAPPTMRRSPTARASRSFPSARSDRVSAAAGPGVPGSRTLTRTRRNTRLGLA